MAMLQGWVRVFSLVSLGRLQRGVTRQHDKELAALAIRFTGDPSDIIVGVLLDVPWGEIPQYIEREHRYELRAVRCMQLPHADEAVHVKALVCVESSDEAYRSDPCKFPQSPPQAAAAAWQDVVGQHYDVAKWGPLWGRKDILPAVDYLALCLKAAVQLGGGAWGNFVQRTLLADGRTSLAQHLLNVGAPVHPLLGAASSTTGGAFVLVGVNASGSAAGDQWPAWWRRTGSSRPPPPFLSCDAPPRPTSPEAWQAHAVFIRTMVLDLLHLPCAVVGGLLVTGAKREAFDALQALAPLKGTAVSCATTGGNESMRATVRIDDDAMLLREVSTVIKSESSLGANAGVTVTAHAFDLKACAAVVLQAVSELYDAVDGVEPGSDLSGCDCGWVDIAPPGGGETQSRGGAASGPTDTRPITTAPMCTVAGRHQGSDSSPWATHLRSFPGATCVLLGAGGACTALAVALLQGAAAGSAQPSSVSKSAVHLVDISADACARASSALAAALGGKAGSSSAQGGGATATPIHGLALPVVLHACAGASSAAAVARGLLAAGGAGSWLVNGTGVGKTSAATPLQHLNEDGKEEGVVWPQHSVFWELNYRGPRPLLGQALRAHNACGRPLVVMDGWRLLHTGWMLNASAMARAAAKQAAQVASLAAAAAAAHA